MLFELCLEAGVVKKWSYCVCVKLLSEKFIMYLVGMYLYVYEFCHVTAYYFFVTKLELMIMFRFPPPSMSVSWKLYPYVNDCLVHWGLGSVEFYGLACLDKAYS